MKGVTRYIVCGVVGLGVVLQLGQRTPKVIQATDYPNAVGYPAPSTNYNRGRLVEFPPAFQPLPEFQFDEQPDPRREA